MSTGSQKKRGISLCAFSAQVNNLFGVPVRFVTKSRYFLNYSFDFQFLWKDVVEFTVVDEFDLSGGVF
jgi:hypothetical protein